MTLEPFKGLVFNAETDEWKAKPAQPIPERVQEIFVVDGKPRMEARLLIDDETGQMSVAGFGAYVVGAVSLCPHGSRQAELKEVKAKRMFAYSRDVEGGVEATRFSPRNPQTGELVYAPLAFPGQKVEGPKAAIQMEMLKDEALLARNNASELPTEESDYNGLPEKIILKDGRVDVGQQGRAVVGCIKTLHTDYLGADRIGLLSELKPGERTPILRFSMGDRGDGQSRSGEQRFTWYVRLAAAPFYQHPLAGVMRLEMHAPEDTDFVPTAVVDIANFSGTLLTRLASAPHKDPRAPQNLIPTAALEQAMSRAMGSQELVTRRIRSHLARELGRVG